MSGHASPKDNGLLNENLNAKHGILPHFYSLGRLRGSPKQHKLLPFLLIVHDR